MKKIITIVLILALSLSLGACGKKAGPTYTLDFDKLEESLFNVTVEGDSDAFNDTYIVDDSNYGDFASDIISRDLIGEYIMFLPNTEWSRDILIAVQAENADKVSAIINAFMEKYSEERFVEDYQYTTFQESGYLVWAVSGDNKAVKEVVKRGQTNDVMTKELKALKTSIPVFGANMPSRLEDEYYVMTEYFDKENLSDMYVLNSTIIGVNPLMIFKPSDVQGSSDTIKAGIEKWQLNQIDTMTWYQPHLIPIIESMELVEENGYLIYIINEYPDVTKAAIASSWVEVAAE